MSERDDVIDEVLRALRKVLGSKTDPRMVEAIIEDMREELYAPEVGAAMTGSEYRCQHMVGGRDCRHRARWQSVCVSHFRVCTRHKPEWERRWGSTFKRIPEVRP